MSSSLINASSLSKQHLQILKKAALIPPTSALSCSVFSFSFAVVFSNAPVLLEVMHGLKLTSGD